jgi:hypothetical protein
MRFEKWLSELFMKLGRAKKVLKFEEFRVRFEKLLRFKAHWWLYTTVLVL